jgi:hypothetical protein
MKCGTKEQTSAHILCKCEALATLRHTDQSSFSLKPEDIMNLRLGVIWSFSKGAWLP